MHTGRHAFVKRVRLIALAAIAVGVLSGTATGAFAGFTAPTESTGNRVIAADVVPPSAVSASGQAGGVVRVTWTATTTAFVTGYSVYRSSTSGGPWTLAGTVAGRTTTQFDDSPGAGDWYYVVRATFQSWVSADSNQAGAVSVLAAPTGVGAAVQSDGRTLRVTWTATASTAATGYAIYRGPSASGPWTLAGSVSGRSTVTYDDVPPADGTYRYVVRATVGPTESDDSAASNAATSVAVDHFSFSAIGAHQNSGRSFSVTITARSASNAVVTGFTQSVTLSTNNGASISPATSGAFSGGTRTVSVSVTGSYSASQTITATGGGASTASAAFTLHDWVFYFGKTTPSSMTDCYGGTLTRDMSEGLAGSDPEQSYVRSSGTPTLSLCTPVMAAAATLPATPVTARLYVANTGGSSCSLSVYALKNGSTVLGNTSHSVPAGTALAPVDVSVPNTGTTLAVGDRLGVVVVWNGWSCNNTRLYWGGTTNRSRASFPVP
jgi:hypothetical protein